MPLPKVHRVVQDSLGNVVPQVLCSVLLEGTGTLATLWQDDAGTIPLSNPMTSDATYGSFGFYVTPGHYDLTFTKPGYTFQPLMDVQVPQDDLTLGTMAQQDANAVAITGGSATLTGILSVAGNITRPNSTGNDQQAFATTLAAAGGTGRWAFLSGGDAPSQFLGKVFFGSPLAASYGAMAEINYNKATTFGVLFRPIGSDPGATGPCRFLNVAGTVVGDISTTATATAYNTSSDSRLKKFVETLTGELDLVKALRPVSFLWQADDTPGVGFLANEVAAHVQGVITGDPDEINPDGTIKPQMIDYSKLVPFLTGAIKTLAAQLEAAEARLGILEDALGV